jgi:diguanylate cyclase (GGDEF)-like protein
MQRWGTAVLRRRPPEVWTMSALYAGASAKCLVGATQRQLAGWTETLYVVVGLACLLVALAVWLAGARRVRVAACPLLGALAAVSTLLVAQSTALGGAMVAAIGYLTVGLYAGYFLPRRVAAALVAVTVLAFAAALELSGLPRVLAAWVTLSTVNALSTLTLSNLVGQLHRLADHDLVTGVLNRAGLAKAAQPLLAAAERYGQPLSAIVIDLDGFKKINDTAGHAAGDTLLADVAARWRRQLRASDVLARAGGDEFVLLAPWTTEEGAAGLAERLTRAAGTACSAGAASYRPGDTLSTLVSRADTAMYEVKDRNRPLPATKRSPAPGGRGIPSPRVVDRERLGAGCEQGE